MNQNNNVNNLLREPWQLLHQLEEQKFNTPFNSQQAIYLRKWYDYFIQSYYDIGLNIIRQPQILDNADFKYFKETCLSLLKTKEKFALGHINVSLSILNVSFHGNEWYQCCERRSAFSFYEDFCLDTILEFQTLLLDTDEWDDRLIVIGKVEGGLAEDKIPLGMPQNHWWWWL